MNVANLAVRRATARTMNFDIWETGERIRSRAREGERQMEKERICFLLPVFASFSFSATSLAHREFTGVDCIRARSDSRMR